MIDATQIGTLLGGGFNKPTTSSYDLITGDVGGVTTSALTPYSPNPTLSPLQDDALKTLSAYINDSVVDEDIAADLQAQLVYIQSLMDMGNQESAGPDPVYALLAGNPESFKGMPTGSVVSTLL